MMLRRARGIPLPLLTLVLLGSHGAVGLQGAETAPANNPRLEVTDSVLTEPTGILGSGPYRREAPGAGDVHGAGLVHGARRIGLNPLELYRVSGSVDPRAFAEWNGPCTQLELCWEGAAGGEGARLVLFDSRAQNLTISYRWRLSDVTTGDTLLRAEKMLNLVWTQGLDQIQGQIHIISPRLPSKGTYLLEIMVGTSYRFEPAPMSPVMLRHQGFNIECAPYLGVLHWGSVEPSAWGVTAMAVQHFNERNGAIAPVLAELDTSVLAGNATVTFGETEGDVAIAMDKLSVMIEAGITGVVGASRSSVSGPTTVIAGVRGIPMISHWSAAGFLSDKSAYPLFSRVYSNNEAYARTSLSFCEALGWDTVAVIHRKDSWGVGLAQDISKLSMEFGVTVVHWEAVSEKNTAEEAPIGLERLKSSGARIIIAVLSVSMVEEVLGIADELEMLENGFTWIVAGALSAIAEDSASAKKNPARFRRLASGIFAPFFTPMTESSMARFNEEWMNNFDPPSDMLERDEWPEGERQECTNVCALLYDATIAHLIAFANGAKRAGKCLSGDDLNQEILNTRFLGASGNVSFDQYGDRGLEGIRWTMLNIQGGGEVGDDWNAKLLNPVAAVWDGEIHLQKDVMAPMWPGSQERTWKSPFDGTCPVGTMPGVEFGECIQLSVLIPLVVIPFALITALVLMLWMRWKIQIADSAWLIKECELDFDVEGNVNGVLGRGTFGLVLRAELRGTEVAVKKLHFGKKSGSEIISERGCSSRNISSVSAESETPKGGSNQLRGATVNGTWLSMLQGSRGASSASSMGKSGSYSLEPGGSDTVRGTSGWIPGLAFFGNPLDSVPPSRIQSSPQSPSLSSRRSPDNSESRTRKATRALRDRMRMQTMIKELKCEVRVLSKLRHPNVTTVIGACLDAREPLLVLEMMQYGSLHDLLKNESVELEEVTLLQMFQDVTQGLRFLHGTSPPVIHGDIKGQNLLVDSSFKVKVADFGFSSKRKQGFVCTPEFAAPEILRGDSGMSMESDVYSFGITLAEVYSREIPYSDEPDRMAVVRQIMYPPEGGPLKRPGDPIGCPGTMLDMMKECWREDPSLRPTFEDLDKRFKGISPDRVASSELKAKHHTENKRLLSEVFPAHIAEALVAGKKVEPVSRESVTIFFSDIVGFTDISGTLTPEKVSDMLHRFYTVLDDLSGRLEVYKVETIGDAYMAVTNLVKDQEDHAFRMSRFAIKAIQAANDCLIDVDNPDRGTIKIRVGLHTGPVVANVVGSVAPRFCLFGDTVNTASRMESNSIVCKVHLSRKAAQACKSQAKDSVLLSRRGIIEVKGKGNMETWWLSAIQEEDGTWHDVDGSLSIELLAESSECLELLKADNISGPKEASQPEELQGTLTRPSSSGRVAARKNSVVGNEVAAAGDVLGHASRKKFQGVDQHGGGGHLPAGISAIAKGVQMLHPGRNKPSPQRSGRSFKGEVDPEDHAKRGHTSAVEAFSQAQHQERLQRRGVGLPSDFHTENSHNQQGQEKRRPANLPVRPFSQSMRLVIDRASLSAPPREPSPTMITSRPGVLEPQAAAAELRRSQTHVMNSPHCPDFNGREPDTSAMQVGAIKRKGRSLAVKVPAGCQRDEVLQLIVDGVDAMSAPKVGEVEGSGTPGDEVQGVV